jgi:DNA-binding response OmpR family regulator
MESASYRVSRALATFMLSWGRNKSERLKKGTLTVILIVESDEELAGAMGELLFDDGFEVCIADSLKYAVGQLPANGVQGVVIDVDGIPLYSDHMALKLMGDWFRHCDSPPPVIVLSMCAPSQSDAGLPPPSISRALWIEWVNKPFQNKEFLSLIRQTVRPN